MKIFLSIILILLIGSIAINAWILTEVSRVKVALSDQAQKLDKIEGSMGRTRQPTAAAAAPQEMAQVKITIDDDPMKGKADAPVTIVEFSDYQCPFCRRNYTQVFPEIEKEYIDSGKVRYVFRDYPLPFHQNAIPAAIAANCAGQQDKYWDMHNYLFSNQSNLNEEGYLKFAEDNKLDIAKYKACLSDEGQKKEIEKDMQDGQKYGVRGTPSFFVGKTGTGKELTGVYIRGARPYTVFKTEIDKLLAEK